MHTLALVIATILSVAQAVETQSPATKRLLEIVRTPDFSNSDADEEFLRAVIHAGLSAVPPLVDTVRQPKTAEERLIALAALAFIGGDAAVRTIRQEYEKGDVQLKPVIPFVLASADSEENRAWLLRLLDGDPENDRETIANAALSVGILRAPGAALILRNLIDGRPDARIPWEVQQSLAWLERGYWTVDPTSLTNERQRVIAAVLKNGIPNAPDNRYFFDEDANGFWKYGSTGWVFTSGAPADPSADGPQLDALIGSDGTRALVTAEILCGRLCGYGYAYVLAKHTDGWRVQNLTLLWIS